MITKRTILSQMEISEGRAVIAHFHMVLEDDGKEISRTIPHTACFMPDADHAAMLSQINAHISTVLEYPPIPSGEWARAVSVCDAVHTPEVKAAYEAYKLARQGND